MDYTKYGFTFVRERTLDEISATLTELVHTKSGAKLIYLDRDDENKTFSIGFTTPPEDDTGVFHIIEHSVLCGSKKYPLKDPFAELLKGSLNTFLNAMTYEDRTVYPVSSRCERDFLNLVDVYMDAVLRPNLLTNPAIFRQEGWHYEYDGKELSVNGVVYNEMKGAYSSADELGGIALQRALFKDDIYRFDSGGDPSHITDLTYEDLKNAHGKYYHPTNAKIVLDGKMDLDKILPLLDSHLSRYDRQEEITLPKVKAGGVMPNSVIKYEIPEGEKEKGRARVLYGFVYSDFADKEAHITASILSDLLCGSNASTLKKILLEKGLAKDAAMYSIKSAVQTVVIEVRDVDEDRICELDETVKNIIDDLVKGGIDKSRLHSTLNSIEFRMRERDYATLPTGIAFAMSVYGSWMHGGAPEDALLIENELKSVREKIDSGYFEKELHKMTFGCPHRTKVIMLPDKELGKHLAKEEENKLSDILKSLGEEEIKEIQKEDEELKAWQEADESEEALSSIPTLTLADIPENSDRPTAEISDTMGVKTLRCKLKTNGIVYVSMHFDASDVSGEDLLSLSVLSSALINLPTKSYDPLSLQNEIKSNLGTLYASFAIGIKDSVATPYFKVGASCLTSKIDDLIDLLKEILLTTEIDPKNSENKKTFRDLLAQAKSQIEDGMIASGESFALSRAEASINESAAMSEYLSGYEAYKLISKALEDEEKLNCLIDGASKLLHKIVTRERLILSVTGDIPNDLLEKMVKIIPESKIIPQRKHTALCADKKEFALIPSKVAYAVLCGKSKNISYDFGIMRVARSILSYEYLWNTVRVRSGAYGAGFVPRRDGTLSFYSYRDPSPEKSLCFYRESSEYLRELAKSGCDITKFIIGAIGEYDFIITPKTASAITVRDYLSGYTAEDENKLRRSMLNMTVEDLVKAADIIDETLSNSSMAIVGGNEHLTRFNNEEISLIKL